MSETIASMATNVVALSSVRAAVAEPVDVQTSAPDAAPTAASQPPVRLHVVANSESGYVYQIVDALTGLLLAEIQRGEARNIDPTAYVAGAIVSTKV